MFRKIFFGIPATILLYSSLFSFLIAMIFIYYTVPVENRKMVLDALIEALKNLKETSDSFKKQGTEN